MARTRDVVATTAGALVCAALLTGTAPPPADLCGARLTADVTLTSDLTCPGAGVALGPGVTLDLGGHTLRGSGPAGGTAVTGPPEGRATVRDGTVADWSVGVSAVRTGALDAVGLTVTATLYGAVQTAGPLRLEGATLVDNRVGVRCSGAGRATTGEDCTLVDTTVRGGPVGVDCYASRCALARVTLASHDTGLTQRGGHTDVVDSVVRGGRAGQETLEGSTRVLRTTYEDATTGLQLVRSTVELHDSVFRHNGTGVQADEATTDVPQDAVGNLFVDNRVALDSGSSVLTLRHNVATGDGRGIRAPYATQTGWNIGIEERP